MLRLGVHSVKESNEMCDESALRRGARLNTSERRLLAGARRDLRPRQRTPQSGMFLRLLGASHDADAIRGKGVGAKRLVTRFHTQPKTMP